MTLKKKKKKAGSKIFLRWNDGRAITRSTRITKITRRCDLSI